MNYGFKSFPSLLFIILVLRVFLLYKHNNLPGMMVFRKNSVSKVWFSILCVTDTESSYITD